MHHSGIDTTATFASPKGSSVINVYVDIEWEEHIIRIYVGAE